MISNQYKELFALVARNGAINGEKAMEVLTKNNSDADIKATADMTQRFRELEDKINAGEELTGLDYVYLYAGATISREILAKNVNTWSAIIHEYDTNLIPKLFEIAKETDPEKQAKFVEENFSQEKVDNTEN